MKSIIVSAWALFIFLHHVRAQEIATRIPIDSKVRLLDLPFVNATIDSTEHRRTTISVNDVKGKNGVIIVFGNNKCQLVLESQSMLKCVAAYAAAAQMGFIMINSNAGVRDAGDNFATMQRFAHNAEYTFPYVIDKEGAKMAKNLGARTMLEFFVIGLDDRLVYAGAAAERTTDTSQFHKSYIKAAIDFVSHQGVYSDKKEEEEEEEATFAFDNPQDDSLHLAKSKKELKKEEEKKEKATAKKKLRISNTPPPRACPIDKNDVFYR